MKQDCVCLKTTKSLNKTERIIKKMGMDIILKTDSLDLMVRYLTPEERIAWLESLEKEMKRNMKEQEEDWAIIQGLRAKTKQFAEALSQILGTAKEDTNYDYMGAIESLRHKIKIEIDEDRDIETVILRRGLEFLPHGLLYGTNEVSCSCLIAKKGQNLLRYIAIERDPLITIQGPEAQSIKKVLERSMKVKRRV